MQHYGTIFKKINETRSVVFKIKSAVGDSNEKGAEPPFDSMREIATALFRPTIFEITTIEG
jgi:hypothetical protein